MPPKAKLVQTNEKDKKRQGPPDRIVVQRSDRKAANAAAGSHCPHRQMCRTGCTGDCD